jgi:hypothetical protein
MNEIPTNETAAAAPEAPPIDFKGLSNQIVKEVLPFECARCNKPFSSLNALRMHRMRVHTRAGQLGARWKQGKKQSQEERKAKKRDYQRQLRARYKAEGRDARGKPREKSGQSPHRWSAKQRANFIATIRRKRNAQTKMLPSPVFDADKKMAFQTQVQFCPRCGCNIKAVMAAIQFADRQ